VTVDDLTAWHDRTIRGKLIIGISGDFDAAAMEAKLRATFEGLRLRSLPRRATMSLRSTPGIYFIQRRREPVECADCGAGKLIAATPTCPALAVMDEILGGGFASRLMQKIRTELGWHTKLAADLPSTTIIQANFA